MPMLDLKDFVSDHRARFEELYDIDSSFFEENLIAKTNDEKSFTLEGHTRGALESLRKFLNENTETFDSFAKRHKIEKQLLLDVLFFAVFFHDIGKGTLEFYNDKILKKQKSYHPCTLFTLLITLKCLKFEMLTTLRFRYSHIIHFLTMIFIQMKDLRSWNHPPFLRRH